MEGSAVNQLHDLPVAVHGALSHQLALVEQLITLRDASSNTSTPRHDWFSLFIDAG